MGQLKPCFILYQQWLFHYNNEMRPALHLKLSQQLKMTPQLQQAIRLLQLSSVDLELEIRHTLESNPLLEQLESEEISNTASLGSESHEMEFIHGLWPSRAQKEFGDTDQYLDFLYQKHQEITLQQHLLLQTEWAHFSDREKIISAALIDAISEEGYLLGTLVDIQQSLEIKTELADIEAVLRRIQQFDPLGVGARNLAECLQIQLSALPASTPGLAEAKILVSQNEYLEALGKRNYLYLQNQLALNQESLHLMIKLLTCLNPKPGAHLSSKRCEYIIPDVLAFKKNGHLVIELNKEHLPTVRINSDYANLLKDPQLKATPSFFKEQLKEAQWFLKGLMTRHETLLKVARYIIEQQQDFFEYGESAMKPLNLQNIAQSLNLHESTVSRITNQKYILTPRGIFELKYFFSKAISLPGGKETSSTRIRAIIKKIIAEESSQAPFSDAKISQLLAKQGIHIARRTVTKYREAMQILAANKRKKSKVN